VATRTKVPSTGEWSPHIHHLLQDGRRSYVAVFEGLKAPSMENDQNTTRLGAATLRCAVDVWPSCKAIKREGEATADRIGLARRTTKYCQSIYFFDPNGHRQEVASIPPRLP